MTEYYIQRDGERLGPFDEATILEDRERGLLRDDDLIWAEGLEHWVAVSAAFAELGGHSQPAGSFDLEPLEEPPEPEPRVTDHERGYRIASEDPMYDIPGARDFTFEYAGFWVRFAAMAIDNIIVYLGVFALVFVLAVVTGPGGMEPGAVDERSRELLGFATFALYVVIPWLYFASLEGGRHSATFGKRAFNLEVRMAHDLERFGFLMGTARYAVSLISAMLLYIGYLMQPFTEKKQALHDLATGTVVIVRSRYSRLLLGVMIVLPVLLAIGLFMLLMFLVAADQGWL